MHLHSLLSLKYGDMEDPSNVPTNQLEITVIMVLAGLSALVGWMTLTGSILAMFKLKGGVSIFGKWIKTPTWGPVWLNPLKVLMVIGVAVLIYLSIDSPTNTDYLWESLEFLPYSVSSWYFQSVEQICLSSFPTEFIIGYRTDLYRFYHRQLCPHCCWFTRRCIRSNFNVHHVQSNEQNTT